MNQRATVPKLGFSFWLLLLATPGAAQEQSVRPGVNDRFLDPEVKAETFVSMFEVESREIYRFREQIVAALALTPGMEVADVGAGTGLFSRLIAQRVGREGAVYAVEIAPKMLEHLAAAAAERGLDNIVPVLGGARDIRLAPASVDLVFVCDTYHHFEYPDATLRTIARALRPGGRLVVVDFERIPGKSTAFALEHVRAGKETTIAEITAAGYTLVREIPMMAEQYVLEFRAGS